MKKTFKIGSFVFSIQYPVNFIFPKHFMLFECQDKASYNYIIEYVDTLPDLSGNTIINRDDILILQTPQGEARYLGVKGWDTYYALYKEETKQSSIIYYLEKEKDNLNIDPLFTSLFALEKHIIEYNEIVLHCAYMIHNGEAILFSAPSETGKTTQATLWEKYRGTRVINGDKALLSKKDGKWYANGWPVCGSSGVCFNESYPIKCIVMLSQAKDNSVELMDPMNAFKQLYSQITVNTWNTEFNIKVMDLIDNLINDIPIYHLACNISEDAVKVLEKKIYGL